jgi:hypothetical protein
MQPATTAAGNSKIPEEQQQHNTHLILFVFDLKFNSFKHLLYNLYYDVKNEYIRLILQVSPNSIFRNVKM